MTETTYRVAGMSCDHCVRAVTEEVGRVPGVVEVDVALDQGLVTAGARRADDVDGFHVTRHGTVTADDEAAFTVQATDDGVAAALQPYLGAYGHLVAIREGDLASLHVHPDGKRPVHGDVGFALHVPSAGRYRLFFDFQVDGVVRTASFTLDVPEPSPAAKPTDGHTR